MVKRHANVLTGRLEDAFLNGCSYISWAELYHWYGVKKIAAGTWRDLHERWEELAEDDQSRGQLMKIETGGGIFILGEKTMTPVNPDGNDS